MGFYYLDAGFAHKKTYRPRPQNEIPPGNLHIIYVELGMYEYELIRLKRPRVAQVWEQNVFSNSAIAALLQFVNRYTMCPKLVRGWNLKKCQVKILLTTKNVEIFVFAFGVMQSCRFQPFKRKFFGNCKFWCRYI